MRILLISNSARGHAVAEALARSRHKPEIITISSVRDPGTKRLSAEQHVGDILDFEWIESIAQRHQFDFAFIAPDDPIGFGLADRLEAMGIPCVAPKKSLARIEASKGFTRDLMRKYGIDASPKYRVFERAPSPPSGHPSPAREGLGVGAAISHYITNELHGDYVVKYDALKGGKGVKISGDHLATIDDGVAYAMECLAECGRVVIEEKLVGVEFSLMAFVSGTQVMNMPAVQDHKRAFDGDTGPNTGGMGTISDVNHSLPFLTDVDLARAKEINRLIAEALLKECGEPYKGILFGGFIAVKDGVRVIEYNARFGDPEALNVLSLLETDFALICQAIINGTLSEDLVRFAKKATVCKYITPQGYPENKDQKGEPVTWPAMPENARLYYGDVTEDDDGTLKLGGSRTAGIVGISDSIVEAERIAEALCEQVKGSVRWRRDIGTERLTESRRQFMQTLRAKD